jgi:PDDEXK-like domain of unknown function (DUF3799)
LAIKSETWNGKTISKPGLYSKIGLDVYHRGDICNGPSVSSSGLRTLFAKSPAHFYAEWPGNPNAVERADKKHFVLGRAAHHLFLGEEYFSTLFAAQPEEYPDAKTGEMKKWTYAANHCKDWRDAHEVKGLSILTPDMIESIRGMAESLSKHPIIRAGALNGMIERSIFFKDKETGLWLKSRPDAIPTSSVDFVDLKTTTSVLWRDLQSAMAEHGYHAQGALVRRAAREVLGITNPTFTLVFVEKTAPYCVRVVTLKDGDLDRGENQNRKCLDAIARCIKSGIWPGPGGEREDAENIELPEWAQKQIDDRLEYGIST